MRPVGARPARPLLQRGARLDWRGQSTTSLTGCGQPRRDAKIYQNRISYKELSDMLHDESSKFKVQEE
jgi:hypothetical protein